MNQSVYALLIGVFLSGCVAGSTTSKNSASTATPSPTITAGTASDRTVTFKMFMDNSGSFDAPADITQGTLPVAKGGHAASRYWGADPLVPKDFTTSNPGWITRFEVGLAGAANTKMPTQSCATFNATTNGTCKDPRSLNRVGPCPGPAPCPPFPAIPPTTFECNSPTAVAYYRSSEYDCAKADPTALTPVNGTGNSDDGVYIRAYFSTDTAVLGASENIMVSIDYLASGISSGASEPQKCITNNTYDATQCAESVWNVYLKPSDKKSDNSEWNPRPFLMLVPPSEHFSTLLARKAETTGQFTHKQIILPMASYRTSGSPISVFQLSHIGTKYTQKDTALINANCVSPAAPGVATPSSQCVGVTFYTITFQRM